MLTDEVKLTTAQRQKWNYFLRNGEPLVEKKTPKKSSKMPEVTIRPGSSKRRTREDIVKSGAYVREKFRPLVPTIDREKAKKHLQVCLQFLKSFFTKFKVSPFYKRKVDKNLEEFILQKELAVYCKLVPIIQNYLP